MKSGRIIARGGPNEAINGDLARTLYDIDVHVISLKNEDCGSALKIVIPKSS